MSRNALFYTLIPLCACAYAGFFPSAIQAQSNPSAPSAFTRAPLVPTTAPRARVVIVQDEDATESFKVNPAVVRALVQRGLTNFTGQSNLGAACRQLVSTQDVVGLKVFSAPGPQAGTRPAVVAGVIEGLLAAKIPPSHIIIWDLELADLKRAGFDDLARAYGVRVAGSQDAGWDEKTFYESAMLGQLVFGDLEFQKKGVGVGRKSFVSRLLTKDITKIINISPLLNHNSAGVCGNLYSLALGSVDNTIRFEDSDSRLAQAVPEIYALPALGERVVLNIVDALLCQYQGEHIGRLHDSTALNQLRFSTDPVALDVLSVQELIRQRSHAALLSNLRTNRLELYQNAALLELGQADPRQIELRGPKLRE